MNVLVYTVYTKVQLAGRSLQPALFGSCAERFLVNVGRLARKISRTQPKISLSRTGLRRNPEGISCPSTPETHSIGAQGNQNFLDTCYHFNSMKRRNRSKDSLETAWMLVFSFEKGNSFPDLFLAFALDAREWTALSPVISMPTITDKHSITNTSPPLHRRS